MLIFGSSDWQQHPAIDFIVRHLVSSFRALVCKVQENRKTATKEQVNELKVNKG